MGSVSAIAELGDRSACAVAPYMPSVATADLMREIIGRKCIDCCRFGNQRSIASDAKIGAQW